MKKPGEFLLQKQKHQQKQRLFDDVKKARSQSSHEFWIDGCLVTTTNKNLWENRPYTNAYAILKTKRGYALAYLVTKDCPRAFLVSKRKIPVEMRDHALDSHLDYSVTMGGLSLVKPRVYVIKLYNPQIKEIWEYTDDLEGLPSLSEIE